MAKTLLNIIDHVRNIREQIKADTASFANMAEAKRRESYINARLKELEINYSEAKSQHLKIIASKEENNLKEKYFAEEVFITLKEAFFDYHGELTASLVEETKGAANTSISQDKGVDIRLRRIELPPFSGGYEEWRPFYDLYMSLIHNDSLADIQKLHYLKASVHGEAARLLQHVSLEGKNYESAWTILTDRYENKRVLVNTHLRILTNQKPLITETAAGIKGIFDTTNECLHSLRNLGIPVDSWDMILVHLLCAKLPVHTQELWESELQGAKNLVEFTTFSRFLETRFRTMEAIEQSKMEFRKLQKPGYPTKPFFKQTKAFHTGFSHDTSSHQQSSTKCRLCNESHNLHHCEQFLKMNVQTRQDTARKFFACLNCLSYNHKVKDCTSNYRCRHCKGNHHSLLHTTTFPGNQISKLRSFKSPQHNKHNATTTQHLLVNQTQAVTPKSTAKHHIQPKPSSMNQSTSQNSTDNCQGHNYNQEIHTLFTQQVKSTKALLATALVKCLASNGDQIILRALIDPGSEATFITENAVQKLKLPKRKTSTSVVGLGQLTTGTAYGQVTLTIASIYNTNFSLTLDSFVYTKITSILPTEPVECRYWKHLEGIELADPHFNIPGKIDLLLGADAYSIIMLPGLRKGSPGSPIAQKTELGWIISEHTADPINKTIHTYHQLIDLDAQLRKFWEIEEIPGIREQTDEEKLCENHFMKTHTRCHDGRYQVSLPFKTNNRPTFEGSRQTALSRLHQLENRFKVNPKLRTMYNECLEDYLTSSHMIEIQPTTNCKSYYLPHHAVFKESSTTKLRVVFDASCKTKSGKSLNDCLMVGPTLQNELTHTIAKWRKFKYAYTADITKMYRQIWVEPQDSNYQLICWRRNTESNIKTYALRTVTFGTASAPYLAIRTLTQLASDERIKFPVAAKILTTNMYVDDVMCGADSVKEAIEAQKQLIGITNSAGFPLRKWASNAENILQMVPPEHREIDIPLTFGKEDYVKALGFQWHPGKDVFKFNFKLPKINIITKRSILSDISRLFDPHGWISPCIVHAKLILQELWQQQSGWDDRIAEALERKWIRYCNELSALEQIEIPRWVHTSAKADNNIQIHGFCDASERAYAAAIYLRVKEKHTINVQLLTAKTKIAPLKRISIPRLELCAALLLAKLLHTTKKVMDFQAVETYAWTDSMITLAWIRSHPSKWKTFVANRVTEIHSKTSPAIWQHINSKDNPADIASRGLFPAEIKNATMWWQGPSILKSSSVNYNSKTISMDTEAEIKKIKTLTTFTSNQVLQETIKKFSSLKKANRVIAYCFRATHNFKSPRQRNSDQLTVTEIEKGLVHIIRAIQATTFSMEIRNIKKKENISSHSTILMLNPFLDEQGILRVGGRLQNSTLSFERKHPIILPYDNHFTNLVIHDAHLKTIHGGLTATSEFIQNKYWIVKAKRNIRRIVTKCIKCFKFRATPATQLMGNLPPARVQISRPFYNTGVDYAGPLEIKAWKGRCNKTYKGYIAIFICLCTKAMHIELVSDLSTAAFMAAYHRFTARRGICRNLYSDQGTNFIGAINKMQSEMKAISTQWEKDITNNLTTMGTQWHLNPPASPHFGGLWEAGVKSVKYHLKRIVDNARLTFEEYYTLLSQIEPCLNSRPLCPKTQDPEDFSTLTPGHFLIMEALNTPPERDLLECKINTLDRWQYIQQLYQTFWNKWSSDYLSRLQQRPKWTKQQINMKIGDLVVIKDMRLPPTHWQLARIIETHPGEDNLIRVVTLKTATTTLQRPVNKICLLPTSDNFQIQQTSLNNLESH